MVTVTITTTVSTYVAVTMTQDEASGKKETQYGKTFSKLLYKIK